jgi:hypothetical protein
VNRVGFALSMMLVVSAATWAYDVNYRTGAALERAERLRERIAAEREAIRVLEVEWAHLNRPDRLEALVAAANRHLGLAPMRHDQFGRPDEIPERAPRVAAPPAGPDAGRAPADAGGAGGPAAPTAGLSRATTVRDRTPRPDPGLPPSRPTRWSDR